MRRELKEASEISDALLVIIGRKAHPDEKGTESQLHGVRDHPRGYVAKHIPMRRELKEGLRFEGEEPEFGRKAHPDEKGTESTSGRLWTTIRAAWSQSTSR